VQNNTFFGRGEGFAIFGEADRVLIAGNLFERWECANRMAGIMVSGYGNRYVNLTGTFGCGGAYVNDTADVDWT